MATIKELKDTINKLGTARGDLFKTARAEAHEDWLAAGGCTECHGHGKVVTWSTLDGPSWTEYGPCSNESCTSSTSGVDPTFQSGHLDWVRRAPSATRWMSDETLAQSKTLHDQIETAQEALVAESDRQTPDTGKIVRIVKAGGGRKDRRPKVGVEGLVIKRFSNDWGTVKLIVLDSDGVKHWPSVKLVEVIDADPSTETLAPYTAIQNAEKAAELEENGFPAVVTVKRTGGKAALVTTSLNVELWIPHSQVAELKNATKGQTLSIVVPGWLAKNKGLIKR